jgi:hypothetical protein
MRAGHLQIEDGIGPERRRFCLPRVNHRLKRLVCIGDDGFITLSALKWLTEVDASFVMLDRLGKVRVVTGRHQQANRGSEERKPWLSGTEWA